MIQMPSISGRVTVPAGKTPIKGTDYWTAEDKQEIINSLAHNRVTSLSDTVLAHDTIIEVAGLAKYYEDVSAYEAFGVTEAGWYVFARIDAKEGVTVDAATTVDGAAGVILTEGTAYVDVAVKFEVAAMSKIVTVTWGGETENFIFRNTDLAIRNLDERVTYYVHPADKFARWEYVLTSDLTFTEDHYYYKQVDGEYVPVPVTEYTIGDPVPADTYYVHSKITFENVTRNVTYSLDTVIDCPVTFILPTIPDDGHGAWFEIRLRHNGSYSMTLVPPSDDVRVATEHTQSETKGINMVNLHYTSTGGAKVWRFINTHSSFTPATPALTKIAFLRGPNKEVYNDGETLDVTGAVVVATFADGSSKYVTPTYTPAAGTEIHEATTLTASYTVGNDTAFATYDLSYIDGGVIAPSL